MDLTYIKNKQVNKPAMEAVYGEQTCTGLKTLGLFSSGEVKQAKQLDVCCLEPQG